MYKSQAENREIDVKLYQYPNYINVCAHSDPANSILMSFQHDTESCLVCQATNVRVKSDLKEAKDQRKNQVSFD